MGNQKRKNKIAYIIMGLVLGLSFVGAWIWYLCTLPSMEEQLQYSPFNVEGTWTCSDENVNFQIISDKDENESIKVSGVIIKDNIQYDVNFNYVSTRGFSHRYAVAISMTSTNNANEESYISFSFGGYNFEEEKFTLRDLRFTNANKVVDLFNEKIDLHFDKIA